MVIVSWAVRITKTPISAPVTDPMPPTMIIAMNHIEWIRVNWSIATNLT